jgi:hypothetical protein
MWIEADTAGVMPGASGTGQTWDFSALSLTTNQTPLDF